MCDVKIYTYLVLTSFENMPTHYHTDNFMC